MAIVCHDAKRANVFHHDLSGETLSEDGRSTKITESDGVFEQGVDTGYARIRAKAGGWCLMICVVCGGLILGVEVLFVGFAACLLNTGELAIS